MLHLFIASITAYTVSASDYCAWGRAVQPLDENNAATYNWLNGEFNRDTSVSSGGQTEVWSGMPYYKMTLTSCYMPVLYLYRHMDWSDTPYVNNWVISSSLGTIPSYGYAYCGASSGVTTDPSTPDHTDCDGNWMVGQPNEVHTKDEWFKVMVGGCPQVTCSSITFATNVDDFWKGVYNYDSPNIYKQIGNGDSTNTAEGGTIYLFWNYKTWRWAVNEYIDDYDDCELYKGHKGFTSVANVNIGPQVESIPVDGGTKVYYRTTSGTATRYLTCTGTVATPNPTARHATVPTPAPSVTNYCGPPGIDWTKMTPARKALCGYTPAPVSIRIFTGTPTSPTTVQPTDSSGSSGTTASGSSGTTASGSSGSTSSGSSGNNTPYPTTPGTARPTAPTTKGPTDQSGTARPTAPTTRQPTSPGQPGNTGDDDGAANTINCNMYLLFIFITIYKLLF